MQPPTSTADVFGTQSPGWWTDSSLLTASMPAPTGATGAIENTQRAGYWTASKQETARSQPCGQGTVQTADMPSSPPWISPAGQPVPEQADMSSSPPRPPLERRPTCRVVELMLAPRRAQATQAAIDPTPVPTPAPTPSLASSLSSVDSRVADSTFRPPVLRGRRVASAVTPELAQADPAARWTTLDDVRHSWSTIKDKNLRIPAPCIHSMNALTVETRRALELKISITQRNLCYPEADFTDGIEADLLPPRPEPLTRHEGMLIVRAAPIIPIFSLANGGQRVYKGHSVILQQPYDHIARVLPRRPEDVEILFVRRDGARQDLNLTVSKGVMLDWLRYLKEHNPYYADIEIDLDCVDEDVGTRLQQNPDDIPASWPASIASIASNLTTPGTPVYEAPEAEAHDIFELPTRLWVDGRDAMSESERQAAILARLQLGNDVINMPARGTGTVLDAQTPGLLSCFPQLFPLGTFEFFIHGSRPRPFTLSIFGKRTMQMGDGRFVRHPCFPFLWQNVLDKNRVRVSSSAGHAFNPQITDMRQERRSELHKDFTRMTAGESVRVLAQRLPQNRMC
ncbi:hypothetical protein BCR37DRAFT_413178 [Protomyces lactucae-debilis]|uniref:DUF6570 domain-containing protein n=1 Tax=Protomyces lactucae-debilis TaxID=2754530 RepID=A0A1Y2FI39_PROLT|nr:uncharacterized protein BCR37DRAFT_413178 [Protomyces lactucae-debilis]ORY83044.1 hypothetical protein BCR37DRAFT_413178 [Protomyces lactucae-debilis]